MNNLSVIIVNYNSKDFLIRCLDSLYEQTELSDFSVVVIDNGSDDRDFSLLNLQHSKVSLIQNSRNLGFAAACNQGLKQNAAEHYLLLNPDCVVEDGAIDKCLSFMEQNGSIGILGCRVNNPDGSLQLACRRRIPRPSIAFYRFLGLSRLFPNNPRFAAYNLGHLDAGQSHEVEAVSGSFLMFRHQVYEDTGGLDEQFFLYGEDLDFCYRAVQKGWRVFYYADASVTHFKNISSRKEQKRTTYHFYEAMETFYRKHFYPEAGRVERMLVPIGIRVLYWLKRARQILLGKSEIGSRW